MLAHEAIVAAPLYLGLRDWQAVRAKLDSDNLLSCRTHASAERIGREVVQRLSELSDDELAYFAEAPGPDRHHLMWLAMCRRYLLVAEFAEEVLRDRFLFGTATLASEDWERFIASKSLWHDELSTLKPSTTRKLRTNVFLALRQADLLTADGTIITPLLSREIEAILLATGETRYFPVRPTLGGRS